MFQLVEASLKPGHRAVYALEGKTHGRHFGLDVTNTGREGIGSGLKRDQSLGARVRYGFDGTIRYMLSKKEVRSIHRRVYLQTQDLQRQLKSHIRVPESCFQLFELRATKRIE